MTYKVQSSCQLQGFSEPLHHAESVKRCTLHIQFIHTMYIDEHATLDTLHYQHDAKSLKNPVVKCLSYSVLVLYFIVNILILLHFSSTLPLHGGVAKVRTTHCRSPVSTTHMYIRQFTINFDRKHSKSLRFNFPMTSDCL